MSSNNLKKSLYQAFKKALGSKQGQAHAAQHIVRDILDSNMIPEAPSNRIPAQKENVLQKDVSPAEIHQQKQAQAEAQLGMTPKMPKTPKMPAIKKTGYGGLMVNEEQGMEAPEKGIGKLRKFMEKSSIKKAQKQKTSNFEDANPPIREYSDVKDGKLGRMHQESLAGVKVRRGEISQAKKIHQDKLEQIRNEPKTKLPK
jgi:hypothetical protein